MFSRFYLLSKENTTNNIETLGYLYGPNGHNDTISQVNNTFIYTITWSSSKTCIYHIWYTTTKESIKKKGNASKKNIIIKTKNIDNGSYILDWIARKLLKAFLEALPQSIIQLTAMVLYQETSIVSVLSICISIVSVSTKPMVLRTANDIKIFLFNWYH